VLPSHGLGNIDHDEVGDVVRGHEALNELVERSAFPYHCSEQAALCVVFAGFEERKKLQSAFGRYRRMRWGLHF
jgi:hypothetical protein